MIPLPRSRPAILLTAVLAVGLLLNLRGLENASHMDEYNEVFEALRLGTGHFNFDRWVKRVWLYVLFVEFGVYFVLGKILGIFSSVQGFSVQIARDMAPLFLIARATAAFCVSVAAALVYTAGRRLHSREAGLLAACLLALSPMAVEAAHFAGVDALSLLLTTATIALLSVWAGQGQAARPIVFWTAFFVGLSFQCRTQGIILALPVLWLCCSRWRRGGAAGAAGFWRRFFILAAGFACGTVAGNPAVLLEPAAFLRGILGLGRLYREPVAVFSPGEWGFFFYGRVLWRQFGPLLAASVLVTLALSFFRWPRQRFLLFFLLPSYLVLGASRHAQNPAYMLPLLPALLLPAAANIAELCQRFREGRHKIWLLACGALLLAAYPGIHSWHLLRSYSGPNTRVLAKEWIETHIPAGSRILMDSGKSYNTFAPQIAENRVSLERMLARAQLRLESGDTGDRRGILRQESLKFYELLLETVPDLSYDITSTEFGLALRPLDAFRREGFEFYVMSREMAGSWLSPAGKKARPASARFYEEAQAELKRVAVILPTAVNRGDAFVVYAFERGLAKLVPRPEGRKR